MVVRLARGGRRGRGRRAGLRRRAQAGRGDAGVQPLLAGRPGPCADHRRYGPRPVHRGGGRAAARRLAAGVGRAGRRFAVPADAAAHRGRAAARIADTAGARGLAAQPRAGHVGLCQARRRRRPVPARRGRRRAAVRSADGPGPGADAGGCPRDTADCQLRRRRRSPTAAGGAAAERAAPPWARSRGKRRGISAVQGGRGDGAGAADGAAGRRALLVCGVRCCWPAAPRCRAAARCARSTTRSAPTPTRRCGSSACRPQHGRDPGADRPGLPGGDDQRRAGLRDRARSI